MVIWNEGVVAGAGGATGGNLIPSVYATPLGTLNLIITQPLGKYVNVTFQAKNLTNAPVQTVYRSSDLARDVLKTSYTSGIELSLFVGAKFEF